MMDFGLYSIGHSNTPIDRFVTLLHEAGVGAIADVRSTPYSRFCPWFSRDKLQAHLKGAGIAYLAYGETLGGRPGHADLYCDGVADYEAIARTELFQSGLNRLQDDMASYRVCMMCAEREPLDCHRCLLVARALAACGVSIGHILHDGVVEPHAATEERLMQWAGSTAEPDMFVTGQNERLTAAYRRRGRAVGYKAKSASTGANTVAEQR